VELVPHYNLKKKLVANELSATIYRKSLDKLK